MCNITGRLPCNRNLSARDETAVLLSAVRQRLTTCR
nr:MAG TPA: hypothetical protein [Caudoviricetes sp.]